MASNSGVSFCCLEFTEKQLLTAVLVCISGKKSSESRKQIAIKDSSPNCIRPRGARQKLRSSACASLQLRDAAGSTESAKVQTKTVMRSKPRSIFDFKDGRTDHEAALLSAI